MATYYVDAARPDDTGDGLSLGSAKKTIQAGANLLSAGDTLLINDGTYREVVSWPVSGSAGNVITVQAINSGLAIIDGSDQVTGWNVCASAAEANGNANYASIYRVLLPAGVGLRDVHLFEGDTLVNVIQTPTPPDLFFNDDPGGMRATSNCSAYSATALTDLTFFNTGDSTYWDGAWVLINSGNNVAYYREINSFNDVTGEITYDTLGVTVNQGSDEFAVLGNVAELTGANQWAIGPPDGSDQRYLYLWPTNSGTINTNVYRATRVNSFHLGAHSYITFDGLKTRRVFGATGASDGACYANGSGADVSNITIKNGTAEDCSSRAAATISFTRCSNLTVQNFTIQNNKYSRGIVVQGTSGSRASDALIDNVTIDTIGGSGMLFQYMDDSTVQDCLLQGVKGYHANGMSFYLSSANITVRRCRVYDAHRGLTFQAQIGPMRVENCVVICTGQENRCVFWYDNGSGNYQNHIIGNTILGSTDAGGAIGVPSHGGAADRFLIRNNILDGIFFSATLVNPDVGSNYYDGDYNAFIDRAWNQNLNELGANSFESTTAALFTDYAGADYTLKADTSPALDAGVAGFYGESVDVLGNARGSPPDIGAHESGVPKRSYLIVAGSTILPLVTGGA